jgi:hypothetical protein
MVARRGRTRTRIAAFACILIALLAVLVSNSGQARAAIPPTQPRPLVTESSTTTTSEDEIPLLDSYEITIQGTRTDGAAVVNIPDTSDIYTCEFPGPDLELAPDQQAVAAYLVSVDNSNCTEVVQIGTPASTFSDYSDMDTATQDPVDLTGTGMVSSASTTATASRDSAATLYSSSAYFRVAWYDWLGWKVNEDRSNISWSWDQTCVRSSSGSGSWWWRSGTGWTLYSRDAYIYRYCSHSTVQTDATFRNGAFCWPRGVVWTYYRDVQVRGWYNGGLGGSVGSTWTKYPFDCPTLLVRVT